MHTDILSHQSENEKENALRPKPADNQQVCDEIPQEAKQLHPLNSAALKVQADDNTEQALEYVNELLKSSEK